MALVRTDPFRQMQDTMNQLFDRRWANPRWDDVPVLATWAPPVDIREEKGAIHLTAELPGVELKDIDISIESNVLTLRGERHVEKDVKEDSYHWRERAYGTFRRTFTLPTTVDRDKIKATFKDGLLQVVLPPKPESMPKQIAVHSAA